MDAELKFNSNDELTFGVHFKHDFEHKYVGRESMHTKSCLNAIPGSVAIRLGGLTTITPENENKHLCEIYPEVRNAMIEARLLKDDEKLPKLGPLMDARTKNEAIAKAKKQKRSKDKRTIYVIQEFTGNWRKEATHKMIERLAKKHGMPWLRVRMAHKRTRNLHEMLLADLAGKIMENVTYLDKGKIVTYKKVCGCQSHTLVN